jgi:hypothetical protein
MAFQSLSNPTNFNFAKKLKAKDKKVNIAVTFSTICQLAKKHLTKSPSACFINTATLLCGR